MAKKIRFKLVALCILCTECVLGFLYYLLDGGITGETEGEPWGGRADKGAAAGAGRGCGPGQGGQERAGDDTEQEAGI